MSLHQKYLQVLVNKMCKDKRTKVTLAQVATQRFLQELDHQQKYLNCENCIHFVYMLIHI